ncbi:hypothetical protein [Cohnella sp. JJ-181]|uniref:hypothetical protein n=1 Tax=Cohnella rhizoplanae TaxID=2974897 RepID=UPI0022FFAA8D|nr:hypothetical protein [Cohnella sp. JJ-181]CAI6041599.1 hypothetical protein COHCIP112018_01109 [Cohnella sp. JJ-181]
MFAFSRQFAPLILAGCILFAGFLTSAYAFFTNFHDRDYVALNAKTIVHLQPGEYKIFYEYNEATNKSGPLALMSNHQNGGMLDLVTVMVDDGRSSLDLAEDTSDVYIAKRMKGEPIYRFSVEQKEAYGITLISNEADLQGQVRFAVMSDFIRVLVSALKKWGLFFAAAAPLLLADFILHIRLERRKIVKTRLSIQP